MHNGMNLAIGLVTYNSSQDLSRTLEATASTATELGAELLVFDNDSSDDTIERLKRDSDATVMRSTFNGGFAYGVNGLFAAAGRRDLLLLNPDVRVGGAEDVRSLQRALEPADVGVVCPRLRNVDGSIQESARQFPTFVGMAGRTTVAARSAAARRAAARYTKLPEGDEATEIDWGIGAAMLISNEANRHIGGWDERFFLYLEDVDFCFRLAQAGMKRLYTPEVEFIHSHHRASAADRGSLMRSQARRHHVKSTLRFFAKHRSLSPTAPPVATSTPIAS